jgi:hypothetical protein
MAKWCETSGQVALALAQVALRAEDGVDLVSQDGGSGLAGYCERCGAAPAERGVVGGREHDSIASSGAGDPGHSPRVRRIARRGHESSAENPPSSVTSPG